MELHELVQRAPNVRNVFLSWNLAPSDDISGLVKTLPSLSPKSLYLGYQRYARSALVTHAELSLLLESCISERWLFLVRLLHLIFPHR